MIYETKKSENCTINPAPFGVPTGWVCPKCGAVLAPTQTFCPFCAPRPNTVNELIWGNSPTATPYTGFDNTAVSNKQ